MLSIRIRFPTVNYEQCLTQCKRDFSLQEGETGFMEKRPATDEALKHSSESSITIKKKPMYVRVIPW